MCPTPEMLKLISVLLGTGFLAYGTYSMMTGTHHDSDDGPVERESHPVQFWIHIVGVYLVGLLIIAAGFQTGAAKAVSSFLSTLTK